MYDHSCVYIYIYIYEVAWLWVCVLIPWIEICKVGKEEK